MFLGANCSRCVYDTLHVGVSFSILRGLRSLTPTSLTHARARTRTHTHTHTHTHTQHLAHHSNSPSGYRQPSALAGKKVWNLSASLGLAIMSATVSLHTL